MCASLRLKRVLGLHAVAERSPSRATSEPAIRGTCSHCGPTDRDGRSHVGSARVPRRRPALCPSRSLLDRARWGCVAERHAEGEKRAAGKAFLVPASAPMTAGDAEEAGYRPPAHSQEFDEVAFVSAHVLVERV